MNVVCNCSAPKWEPRENILLLLYYYYYYITIIIILLLLLYPGMTLSQGQRFSTRKYVGLRLTLLDQLPCFVIPRY